MTGRLASRNRGITLVELMLVALILAIALAVTLPNFSNLIKDNRIETRTSEFVTDLAYARSEAIKRRSAIEVIATTTGEPTSAASWSTGWMVSDAPTQTVLRANSATSSEQLSNTEGISQLTFLPTGYIKLAGISITATTFKLCDDRQGEHGQIIRVAASGQIEREVNISCP